MSETSQLPVSIPKTAIVIFNDGAFGGAVARFTSLFLYLNKKFPHKFYYFINTHLFNQINEIYKDLPLSNIRIIGRDSSQHNFSGSPPHLSTDSSIPLPRYYKDTIPDPEEVDRRTSFPRKIYWYYKNKFKQHALFRKIEKLREELDIKVFTGVFAGILPLIFYLNISPKKAAVIFSDMDSWFTDVHWDMKKLWYRKYFSFNYALENSDTIDFLSPYIFKGIKEREIKINEEKVAIAPCSFTDYSKCKSGDKKKF